MNRRRTAGMGGVAATLALFALTASVLVAQTRSPSTEPRSEQPLTHEQMHQMMDAIHGAGTSARMHEAMGEDAEALMDQCKTMMTMMPDMRGRMMGR